MSDSNPASNMADDYVCKICGLGFSTPQALGSTYRFRTSRGRTT